MAAGRTSEITRILSDDKLSAAERANRLLPLVYDQLRAMAAQRMASERAGHTLQATALVHEAYLRLVGDQPVAWQGRAHFFAAAAEAMRRILIDRARARKRAKRGGERRKLNLDDVDVAAEELPEELLALDEALVRLAAEDSVKAELVKLRYFGGLTLQQSADLLGISRATADRYWSYARAWLYHEISQ